MSLYFMLHYPLAAYDINLSWLCIEVHVILCFGSGLCLHRPVMPAERCRDHIRPWWWRQTQTPKQYIPVAFLYAGKRDLISSHLHYCMMRNKRQLKYYFVLCSHIFDTAPFTIWNLLLKIDIDIWFFLNFVFWLFN